MFRRQNAEQPAEVDEPADEVRVGKGAPTPTRKQQEAARRRPLVPDDRREAARQARAQQTVSRERARAGMAAGDDKYLTARDRGPQRRYVRDYVDARYNVGEALIPILLVVIIMSALSGSNPVLQTWGLAVLWGFAIIALIDCVILGMRVRSKLGAKYGVDQIERGLRWYAGMRALQFRFIRLPKPQNRRGEYPE